MGYIYLQIILKVIKLFIYMYGYKILNFFSLFKNWKLFKWKINWIQDDTYLRKNKDKDITIEKFYKSI